MGDATNIQTSFLGGEVAPSMQGRADLPKYQIGLNKSLNGMPAETGSWQRRPGTRMAALTRGGTYAKIIDFDFSQNAPYTAEFTNGHLRFFAGYSLVHTYDPETVVSISTATPAVVTVNGNTVYANGDMVEFTINAPLETDQGSLLQGKQFLIGSKSGATFALFDSVTGSAIDGSTLNFTAGTPTIVQRVLDLATPYQSGFLSTLRGVQASNNGVNTLVVLHNQVPPQAITATTPPSPTFTINAASFIDGPYLDPPGGTITITPSGVSGTITLTASSALFAATDVGRHIRLFSQPATWASGTAYSTGNLVTYNGGFYVALQGSTGAVPGTDAVNWGVATNATAWVWGIITVFTNSALVTCALQVTEDLPGVLTNTHAIPATNYQFGLFNSVTGYAACGTYHEGRLWLSGVLDNRVDASKSNDIFNMSPSAVDGTVADNNAISYTFNAQDLNSIFWMQPQQTGILCGTQAGEWLIQASTNGDVLTPTSIQAKRVTRYGCANVDAVNAPFATLFVSRNSQKVFEYLADVFTGKYSGINVSLSGSHLTSPGVAEIRYQKELSPIMWARMTDGSIAGMTYRRESPMLSEQPAFSAWHPHTLGTGRQAVSIAVGPSIGGNLDTLTMVTYDATDQLYRVELLADMFSDKGTNLDAWFVDGATVPSGGSLLTANQLTLYGLSNYEGQTVSAYIAGIDAGDYIVTSGQIVIPLPAGPTGLLTEAAIQAANGLSSFAPTQMPVMDNIAGFPTNTQSIQSYIGPSSPVSGVEDDNILLDVANNRLFEFKQGDLSTSGIRCFNLTTGLQTNAVTFTQLFGSHPSISTFLLGPYCLGYDGFIYCLGDDNNSSVWLKIDPNLLRIVGKAGVGTGSVTPAPNTIPAPNNMAQVRVGGKSFVLGCAITGGSLLSVVEMTDKTVQNAGHTFVLDENTGYVSPTYDGSGVAYSLGFSSTVLGVYKTTITAKASRFNLSNFPTFTNSNIVTTKLGTIAPASIDATWTSINAVSSFCYDNSDGNLIFAVNTSNSVTNKYYLVKINASSLAVMWATPLSNNFPPEMTVNAAASYAAYNKFALMIGGGGAGNSLYLDFNTSTGVATSYTVVGVSVQPASLYDARLGSVFGNAGFTSVGGSPTQLNSTPATFSYQWFRLLVNAAQGTAASRQFYTVPAAVGKTYTSQGQRLRPLSGQETGAKNGPALGKTRRNHRFAAILLNTTGISFGTTFANLNPVQFKNAGGTSYLDNQLYSGVFSDTLEDDNSYDGMICWQISRPYPANVLALQGFLETQDR